MKREYDAYIGLRAAAENRRPHVAPRIERKSFLQALISILGGIADRIAPLIALCGLLFVLGLLAETLRAVHIVPLHLLWSVIALALAMVAMRAFWGTEK